MSSEKEPQRRAKLGCRNLAVLSFVGLVWVLISLLALSRAITVGWPAMLSDEGVLALSSFSLALLLLVIIKRDELVTGGAVSCPKCDADVQTGQYRAWQFVVAICFFPLGLLALLAGRAPTKCLACGHQWQA